MKKSILLILSMVKDLLRYPMSEFDHERLNRIVELLEEMLAE